MMDLAATHRNIDVIQPCSHSCSKMAPDGVAEKRRNADRRVARGDNLANRRDDKFTDQRERASKERSAARGTLSTSDYVQGRKKEARSVLLRRP